MTPEHGEAGAAFQCTHKVCFHFSSICSCCEKITERLTALNIPNSWHARETMSNETMYQQDEKTSHFFPLFCEKVIFSTTKER